ncbi:hypothetical protein J3F84DRAFT_391350 [Trichoderma pleuroticola]
MTIACSATVSPTSHMSPPSITPPATSESTSSLTLAPTADYPNTAVEVKAALAAVIGVAVAQPVWCAL